MKLQTKLIIALIIYAISGFMVLNASENYPKLKIQSVVKDVSCYGLSDGKIEIEIQGGKAPYIVVWDNGSSGLIIDNLRSGIYSVKVCDARGKILSENFSIESPDPIELTFDNNLKYSLDFLNSMANIELQGGTPWVVDDKEIYFFRLNDCANFNDSIVIQSDIYELSIEDSRGCTLRKEVYIENINIDNSVSVIDRSQSVVRLKKNEPTKKPVESSLR